MIVFLFGAILLANVDQPFPDLAPLQHGPIVMLLLGSPLLLRRWALSDNSIGCIVVFLLLHTLGARYIYSYVPYDAWFRLVTGHNLSDLFGWHRNGYDRLVHVAFGALLTAPTAEIATRYGNLHKGWSLAFAFAIIGLGSTLYEIFEWMLTMLAAGSTADYYNGQQGDVWDPQKDMLAALIGSMLAVMVLQLRARQART